MVLPLATLFAAVMTMGNMGENYELLALKSAGISLPKIMRPLIILVLFVAVGSFFVANNLVPIATKKISALLYDIRQQKQSIEFKDGLFFNGMDDISIRVDRQDPKTKLLNGVLIYDTSDPNGNMTTTLADSGYISCRTTRSICWSPCTAASATSRREATNGSTTANCAKISSTCTTW